MARKTKKYQDSTLMWDTLNHSWNAVIYSSGGTTHTVYVEVVDDSGKVVEKYDKTFTGEDACQRAYDFAEMQKRESTRVYSKWMTPRLHPESCKGMAATEITKTIQGGEYKSSSVLDAIYYTALKAHPGAILLAVFDQGLAKSCLYEFDGKLSLISEYAGKEVSDLLV